MPLARRTPTTGSTATPTGTALYETDLHAWTVAQAASLRNLRPAGIDVDHVAEEIESLGNQQRQEIEHRLDQLLMHLLKAQYQPVKWKGGWQATIKVQRIAIQKLLVKSPSLKRYPAEVLHEEYAIARLLAVAETGLDEDTFPTACPFTIDEVMDDQFFG